MELTISAENNTGMVVAELVMRGPAFDINSVMAQFKVLVAPTDSNKFKLSVFGLLTQHRKNITSLNEIAAVKQE